MQEGDLFLERYRIERVLGSGGMGLVVAATDLRTEQQVALKLLRHERARDADAAARMLREAEAVTRLVGRHSCRVLDVVWSDEGEPVLVMELLEGEDLARTLARVGRLSEAEAVQAVLDACEGVAEAHAMRMVHRDLKPSNLFRARELDGTSVVKVIDFGVVKNELADAPALTTTTSMAGSVAYMSPEQLRKLAVDARADVWSLGVVLYELIAGTRPFPAQTITDASIRIAVEAPEPLPASVSAPLADAIARCLEKNPLDRFQDVAELAGALAPLSAGGGDQAARVARVLDRAGVRARQRTTVPAVARAVPPPSPATPASVRVRDAIARHWFVIGLGVLVWSLALLLGSFAVDDRLNQFAIAGKPTGYVSSFNWTLVHTFFCPLTIAVIGSLLQAIHASMTRLGEACVSTWNAVSGPMLATWVILAAILGIGYTTVEWSFVTTGRCDSGTFLGWPNQLCEVAGGSAPAVTFMVLAAVAQAVMLSAGWLLLSVVIWLSVICFGVRRRLPLDGEGQIAVGRLFGLATWGWAALVAALYVARLWSVHLATADTQGVLATVMAGAPSSLFEISARTQTDWGSMIAGAIMLVAATAPLALLRLRAGPSPSPAAATVWRAALALGGVGLLSMTFPRLGFWLLPALGITGFAVGQVRRALLGALPPRGVQG